MQPWRTPSPAHFVSLIYNWTFQSESDIQPSMVTHAGNLCSTFYPSKCTHTHTHIVNTHPEQWAAIYAVAPGEQSGFGALLKGTSSWYCRWRERCTFTHLPPPAGPRLELATFRLWVRLSTIRPRLPISPYRKTYKMCSAGGTSWRGLRTTR